MPAVAHVNKRWKQKTGIFPLVTAVFTALFIYDGLIGYPRNDRRYEAHRTLSAEEWQKLCAKEGWSTTPPTELKGPGKYREQMIWAGIFAAIALVTTVRWMRGMKTFVASDETGVTAPSGVKVPYEAITHVDQRKWREYGLAYISYSLNGRPGKFTLDYEMHQEASLETVLSDIMKNTAGKATVDGGEAAK